MRRHEKEIQNGAEIEAVIRKAEVCRLGLSVDNRAYIVPLNFGYQDGRLYFHTAPTGRKIEMIQQNRNVCFELESDCELVRAETPCDWTMKFRSVIGYGKTFLLTDRGEKRQALDIIMEHYSGQPGGYPDDLVDRLAIIRLDIEQMTGKRSGR